jgi:hypothetical protein
MSDVPFGHRDLDAVDFERHLLGVGARRSAKVLVIDRKHEPSPGSLASVLATDEIRTLVAGTPAEIFTEVLEALVTGNGVMPPRPHNEP